MMRKGSWLLPTRLIIWVGVLLLLSGPAAGLDPKDQTALEVMNQATKDAVKQTGTEAAGVGSWVSQKNYKGPLAGGTSDHDMRVVMTGETNTEEIARKWKDFQGTLKENIRTVGRQKGLSDAEINKLVNSTNVYPPNQLMEGIESSNEAAERFKKLGTKPSLGSEPVEGLWGQGSKGYTQHYEEKAGKLFYVDGKTGRVVTGGTDLTHLSEGLDTFTTAGEVNKGGQWANKALEKLEAEGPEKAAKHVERLRQSLNKARSIERVGVRADYLDDIVTGRIKDPAAIRTSVERAQGELNLLQKLSTEANSRNRELLKGILNENLGKWATIRGAFWKYAGKVPTDKLLRGFQLYTYYARVNDVSKLAGEDFNAAVLKTFPELGYLAGLAPGLAMEIAASVLEGARAGAYGVVTAFQECTTLLEGISMVKGRENVGTGMTIEQLASRYPDTQQDRAQMMNVIWYQATNASYREENGRPVSDPKIAEALYQRCAPQIVGKWQEQRLAMIDQFNGYFFQFNNLMVKNRPVITITPSEVVALKGQGSGQKTAAVTVSAGTSQDAAKIQELYQKMAAILGALEGGKGQAIFVSESYRMTVDGAAIRTEYKPFYKSYAYTSPGDHGVSLAHEMSLAATYVSSDVGEYSLLGGYKKAYSGSTTTAFSIIQEAARATIKISGPSTVKVKQPFTLTASVQDTNLPGNNVFVSWADQKTGKRYGGFSPTLTTSQVTPGRLNLIAEAFMLYNKQYVKLADARYTVMVEDEEKKPDKKPEEKKPDAKKPDPKPQPPPAQKTGRSCQDIQKEYEQCFQSEKKSYEESVAWSQKVGQKDYWTLFRCGDIGTDWQIIPSKECCDPWRKSQDHEALQRCGWKEELARKKAALDKRMDECRKKYPPEANCEKR